MPQVVQSFGGSSSVLGLMQQLQDAQHALRASESRCEVLQEENERLRGELSTRRRNKTQSILVNAALGVDEATPQTATTTASALTSSDASDAKAAMISQLQQQLTEVLRRNTKLEREMHSQHSALRHNYEAHVERLELELRRAKAMLHGSSPPPAASLRPQHQHPQPTRRDIL